MEPTIIGGLASALTTVAFLPQVTRSLRTRSAGDFAWSYLLLFVTGVACWLVYGLIIGDVPIVAGNAVVLASTLVIAAVKVREARVRMGVAAAACAPAE